MEFEPIKPSSSIVVSIRSMDASDLQQVTELAIQLGYGPTFEEVSDRFSLLRHQPTVGFFVAHGADPTVISGWIHVYGVHTLVSTPYAEIGGIVVDEATRRSGVGGAMMNCAEQWALRHGYREVRLRSGHHREVAHRFYKSIGYEIGRASHTFRRQIGADVR